MIVRVKLPKSGMGIEEASVARWYKAEGEIIQKGERLAEIETAKALETLESPVSGKIVKILLDTGQSAAVHTDIAAIEVGNELT